jgi:hypothetical protein
MDNLFWISRDLPSLSNAQELIAAIALEKMETPDKMTWRSLGSNIAYVNQRWLVIFSPEAYQRGLKTVNKLGNKQSTSNLKAFEKLCRQDFASVAEAQKALNQFEKTLNLTEVAEKSFVTIPHYSGAGRPSKKQKPDKITIR